MFLVIVSHREIERVQNDIEVQKGLGSVGSSRVPSMGKCTPWADPFDILSFTPCRTCSEVLHGIEWIYTDPGNQVKASCAPST
jgi:hypothetical protein